MAGPGPENRPPPWGRNVKIQLTGSARISLGDPRPYFRFRPGLDYSLMMLDSRGAVTANLWQAVRAAFLLPFGALKDDYLECWGACPSMQLQEPNSLLSPDAAAPGPHCYFFSDCAGRLGSGQRSVRCNCAIWASSRDLANADANADANAERGARGPQEGAPGSFPGLSAR